MLRKINVVGMCILIITITWLVWTATPLRCKAQENCPEPAAYDYQPYPTEISYSFIQAGTNRLGNQGPVLQQIWKGYPPAQVALVPPYVPCILLNAVGYTESAGWKQFDANYGQNGNTVISNDCGYGIMQITSGMEGGAGFEPNRVASEPVYNIGTGTRILIEKWNVVPYYIGSNNPAIIEEWYFAVWAYNEGHVGSYNNPNRNCPTNNPDYGYAFNPNRPVFDGTQPRSWYPYQELIWGYAAHPPSYNGIPFWQAIYLTLPPRATITDPPPSHIDRPEPAHRSCDVYYLPLVMSYRSDTYEPNDSFDTAYSVQTEQWYFSYIWSTEDNDWYKFHVLASASSPKLIEIWLHGIPVNTDYDLELYSPSNNYLSGSRNGSNFDEYIHQSVTQSGWFRARVFPFTGYSHIQSYRIWFRITDTP